MKVVLDATRALEVPWTAKAVLGAPPEDGGAGLLPDGARSWLAGLRLLEGVPFEHLVSDAQLLPDESIRFFYLDRNWTDALVDGALSVGAITTADRAQLQAVHQAIRDELDRAERGVRVPGNELAGDGPADVVCGFLLRSAAVSGWPALHVRAFRDEVPDNGPDTDASRLHLMRLERLAPAVLLALFDGVPKVVHIDEPKQGIQFGIETVEPPPGPGQVAYTLPLRDAATGLDLPHSPANSVPVPFRSGAPGVINMHALQQRIHDKTGAAGDAIELALQLLRFPYRQVFGAASGGGTVSYDTLFEPTVSIRAIRDWPRYEVQP